MTAGCGGSSTTTLNEPAAPAYPGGLGPYSSIKGIYADKWTAANVSFLVAIPRTAQRMRLRIDVPTGRYKRGAEGIVVQLGDEAPQEHVQLPQGPQVITVPIAPSLRGKTTKVSMSISATFVPQKIGLNSDGRELGILFNDVSFQ